MKIDPRPAFGTSRDPHGTWRAWHRDNDGRKVWAAEEPTPESYKYGNTDGLSLCTQILMARKVWEK